MWSMIARRFSLNSGVVLDVKAEGYMAQCFRQLRPQQNLFQIGGCSVLVEGGEDVLLASLGRARRLLRVRERDGSHRHRRMDGAGGGRWLPRGLHVSRGARGVLADG